MLLPSYLQSSRNSCVWLSDCFHWAVAFPARSTDKNSTEKRPRLGSIMLYVMVSNDCDIFCMICNWVKKKVFSSLVSSIWLPQKFSSSGCFSLQQLLKNKNKQTPPPFFIATLYLFFLLQKYPPRMMRTFYFYCDNAQILCHCDITMAVSLP